MILFKSAYCGNVNRPTEEIQKNIYIFAVENQQFKRMEYKHRIADKMLAKKLASKGVVLIEGRARETLLRLQAR